MPISISDLFSVPLIYWVDLAPDGVVVLYSSNATGIPHLYVLQTKLRSKPKQITSGNDSVTHGFFSTSGDHIVYFQDKDGNELHHLFLTSKEGEVARRITEIPYRTWYGGWHPNGKEFTRSYAAKKSCGLEVCSVENGENFKLKQQEAPFFDVKYSHEEMILQT